MSLILCSECGKEISDKAERCPNCGAPIQKTNAQNYQTAPNYGSRVTDNNKKSSQLVMFLLIFAFVCIIGIVIIFVSDWEGTPGIDSEQYITLDEFNQIQAGMTYDEVVEIIGSEGTVMSTTTFMDTTCTIYYWYAEDGIANANVTFTNDVVDGKAQIGLR